MLYDLGCWFQNFIDIPSTNYFMAGMTAVDYPPNQTINMMKVDGTQGNLSNIVINTTMPAGKPASALEFLSGNSFLAGTLLSIWDVATTTITRSTSVLASTVFKFIGCLSATSCVATDNSASLTKVYSLTSATFLSGTNDAITSSVVIPTAGCVGLGVFPLISMYSVCTSSFCVFKSIASPANVYPQLSLPFTPDYVQSGSDAVAGSLLTFGVTSYGGGAGRVLYYTVVDNTVQAASLTSYIPLPSSNKLGNSNFMVANKYYYLDYYYQSNDMNIYFYGKASCDVSCQTCYGTTNAKCIVCAGGYIMVSGSCSLCNSNCLTCSIITTNCTSCTLPKYVSSTNSTCALCGNGFYTSGGYCYPCNANCLTCATTATTCTSCTAPNVLSSTNSTCAVCGNGYYVSGTTCYPCNANCLTCTTTATTCTSCTLPNSLSSTNATCAACGSGYYLSGTTCYPCNANCLTCATTATTCTSCTAPNVLSSTNSTCAACGSGYYVSGSTCFPCNANCVTCVTSSVTCTSCTLPKYVSSTNSTCALCGNGFYTSGGYCYPCNANCLTCATTATTCTSCTAPNVLSSTNSTCAVCGNGYYVSGTTCYPCNANCLTCTTSATTCTSCTLPNYLSNTNATCAPCGNGYFLIGTTCYPCNANCLTCATSATTCTSCTAPNLLSSTNSTCAACGNGYFVSGTTCYPCNSNCLTCATTAVTCTTCTLPNYLSSTNFTCAGCGNGYYLSGTTCYPCDPNCLTCSGTSTTCTSCTAPNLISSTNSTCAPCGNGYFPSGTTCYTCNANCLTCATTATTCTSCTLPNVLSSTNSTCAACGNGFFVSGTTCYPCNSNCLTCLGTATNCTSCTLPNYVSSSTFTCAPCGIGFYTLSGFCYPCSSNCITCSMTATNCTLCLPGLYLSSANRTCGACGAGFYSYGSPAECSPCSSACPTCAQAPTTCTSCTSPLVLTGTTCLPCDSSCLTCSTANSPTGCLSCDTTQGLYFFAGNSTCTPCFGSTVIVVNNICQKYPTIPVRISTVVNPKTASFVNFSLLITVTNPTITDPGLFATVMANLQPTLQFIQADTGNVENFQRSVRTVFATSDVEILNVKFLEYLMKQNYNVLFLSSDFIPFNYSGYSYAILPYNFTFNYTNPKATKPGMDSTASQAGLVGQIVSPNGKTPLLDVIALAVAADPTGCLSRLWQTFRLYSRLWYLNINFGDYLEEFLRNLELASGTLTEPTSIGYMQDSSLNTRGKLSRRGIVANFMPLSAWKFVLYAVLQVLSLLRWLAVSSRVKTSKRMLVVMYLLPKIRCMLLNGLLLDLLFYGCHSLLHFSSPMLRAAGAICVFMFSFEVAGFVSVVLDSKYWQVYTKLNPDHQNPSALNYLDTEQMHPPSPKKSSKVAPLHFNSKRSEDSLATAASSSSDKAIDYNLTYANLNSCTNVLDPMVNTIDLSNKNLLERKSRIFVLFQLIRMPTVQICLIACQYLPLLAIFVLAGVEASKLVFTLYARFKYKIFRHDVFVVFECSENLILFTFLLICSYCTPQDAIAYKVQVAGIFIIILAFCVQVCMLLILVATLLYDLLRKNRDERIQAGRSMSWFIIYRNDRLARSNSNSVFTPKTFAFRNMNSNLDNPLTASTPKSAIISNRFGKRIPGKKLQPGDSHQSSMTSLHEASHADNILGKANAGNNKIGSEAVLQTSENQSRVETSISDHPQPPVSPSRIKHNPSNVSKRFFGSSNNLNAQQAEKTGAATQVDLNENVAVKKFPLRFGGRQWKFARK